jgi:hypothetical protein
VAARVVEDDGLDGGVRALWRNVVVLAQHGPQGAVQIVVEEARHEALLEVRSLDGNGLAVCPSHPL